MANETTSDLELSEIWDRLTEAGASLYEWTDQGVTCGVRAIRLGPDHWLTASDTDGYKVLDARDVAEDDLIPEGEVDDEAAIRAASDLTGFVAVVGLPGSVHHSYRWFDDRDEAREWLDWAWAATLDNNWALGMIEGAILTAEEAFEVEYRDGRKVYFRPNDVGPGFRHSH